jgi:hypothetical protein
MKALAVVFAAIPFAFGLIRAFNTGTDVRYIWVALGAMIGGMIATTVARRFPKPPATPALVVAVFVTSAVLAVFTARLLGTTMGPGLLVVATAFAACFAAASLISSIRATRG